MTTDLPPALVFLTTAGLLTLGVTQVVFVTRHQLPVSTTPALLLHLLSHTQYTGLCVCVCELVSDVVCVPVCAPTCLHVSQLPRWHLIEQVCFPQDRRRSHVSPHGSTSSVHGRDDSGHTFRKQQ